ncbi:hypothetical protein NC652_005694, partial [Populus alba x Populus x berolinensis]
LSHFIKLQLNHAHNFYSCFCPIFYIYCFSPCPFSILTTQNSSPPRQSTATTIPPPLAVPPEAIAATPPETTTDVET